MPPTPADAAQAARPTTTPQDIAAAAAELVACGSLEMGADAPEDARRIAELLPAGTPVYVNHLPRRELAHTLPALAALAEAGLEPVPHIAARRVGSRAEAQAFLQQAVRLRRQQGAADRRRRAGARRPLCATARRCCATACSPTAACSRSGWPAIPKAIRASPPPRSPPRSTRSWRSRGAGPRRLRRHAVLLRAQPHRRILRRPRPPRAGVPVYVGLPGPTNPRTLLRYAQRCGVSASLRALQAQGMGAVRLFTHVDPTEQLTALARHCAPAAPATWSACTSTASAGSPAPPHWMNERITARG